MTDIDTCALGPDAARGLIHKLSGTTKWTLKQLDNRSLRVPTLPAAKASMRETLARLHRNGLTDRNLSEDMPGEGALIGSQENITERGRQCLNIMRGVQ